MTSCLATEIPPFSSIFNDKKRTEDVFNGKTVVLYPVEDNYWINQLGNCTQEGEDNCSTAKGNIHAQERQSQVQAAGNMDQENRDDRLEKRNICGKVC